MTDTDEKEERIQAKEIEEEMKESYLDYAMSVIVGRALPDVRDGLKPVHRRVLYTMFRTGILHNKPYRKSANVVGNCMAKYHPHGDASIYDTLVRMTQPFSLRYPLVQGQGNFGSIDGDSAAAMRYTEARMEKISEELLQDIDKETVNFEQNFDNSTTEPTVLPAKLPNLLLNGSSGIAVGMATNIPPHNLKELADAIVTLIEDPDATINDLISSVQGPDFPTGGIIQGRNGIIQAYNTGRGKVIVRCRYSLEDRGKNAQSIIITEIPYMVNKSILLEGIANLVKNKVIEGIVDIRDESDRDGMRIVIELRQGVNSEVIMNQLYKHSRLQDTFGMNMLALVNNQPMTLNLKEIISYFIAHRKEVIIKRTEFDLRQAEDKAHILEGLIIALKNIDEIIEKIKKSKDTLDAKEVLMKDYDLSEKQAKVILEMRLQRLSSMERQKIQDDYKSTLQLIDELKSILADEAKIYAIIKDETLELKEKYGDNRRSDINDAVDLDIDMEDLIDEEDVIVSITQQGYVKRVPIDTYREQRRGGKGVIATGKKDEDFIEDIFVANTHQYLLAFTDKGNLYWLKVYRIPTAGRNARGTHIANLLEMSKEENISAIVAVEDFKKGFVVMATKNGIIKKVKAELFSRPRRTGIIAITLEDNDELIKTKVTDGEQVLMVATKEGKAVRFNESDVRAVGRTAKGVTAIRLQPSDEVIGMIIAKEDRSVLTVTENGYGKRTDINEYRLIRRGGTGVRNIICSERNGKVHSIKSVEGDEGIVIISEKGLAIRTAVRDISKIGRNTQGVRLMKIGNDDKIVAVAKVAHQEEEENTEDE